jgi:uncharacterized membrane protein
LPLKSAIKCIAAVSISLSFLYATTFFTTGLLIGIPLAIVAGLIYLIVLIWMKFYIKEDVRILETFASKSPFFKEQISFLARFLSKHT